MSAAPSRPGVATARQIQGKELSYNNLNDTDAAYELVAEFDAPAVAIIKHANPCGVAVAGDLAGAYAKALACDPVSAFGGIIAVNRPLDAATAEAIGKLFVEVVIAPEVDARGAGGAGAQGSAAAAGRGRAARSRGAGRDAALARRRLSAADARQRPHRRRRR